METIFMNTENSKTNEPHKFFLNLSQRLDLIRSDKHVALQNLYIHYTRKNIRKQYKHNKLKILAPTWNLNYQMVLILCQIFKIILNKPLKTHETWTIIPPIHVYLNRINNILMFKKKDGYKLELQTPETINLFVSTIKLTDKTKNEENVPRFEVVEVVLVQCNLVDNHYQ